MQFILRSRCTRIRLPCGCECDRDVVSAEQATTLDTSYVGYPAWWLNEVGYVNDSTAEPCHTVTGTC